MKKIVLLVTAALLSVCTLSFGASSLQPLDKSQATQTIQDKTITTIPMVTLNGQLINNTFTGYFDKTGTVKGQLANKPDNDPQTDQGTWMVKSDGTLCATWQHWDNSKPICVSIYKLNNGILFVNQQTKKFESYILQENIKSGNQIS